MNNVFFHVLRRMRVPLIVLITLYAVSVLGLTLIPGVDAAGKPSAPMSFFHAFYFISYTATTIGFGEIPTAFSDAQRLWVVFCIYLTVIGWSYSILTILALFQDKGFQNTLVANRFARRVRHIREPFYLICGCGETGSLVCQTLDRLGRKFVILEKNELCVQELDLVDFKTDTPVLACDARLPANLMLAGLRHDKCCGVLALTDNEEVNLAIAIATRLVNPDVQVLARALSPLLTANMASFGTNHIINPFERFAEYLALAVAAPQRYRLLEILTGLPGTPLSEPHRPPRGRWVVCGYGRFGHAIVQRLALTGIHLTIIDPRQPDAPDMHWIQGIGTDAATLRAAGIEAADGIVAGSDNDVNNLSIAVTARELNPRLFVVTRQNYNANTILFEAFRDDFCMVPNRIIAQESIAILTTPLLTRFLDQVRTKEEPWCHGLANQLEKLDEGRFPDIWGLHLNVSQAFAVHRAILMDDVKITLADLQRDNVERDKSIAMMPLLLVRGEQLLVTPEPGTMVEAGDQILFAGCAGARSQLELTLDNANVLDYVLTGRERPNSWIWRWISEGSPIRTHA
ncbi:MAG: potassium channel protein [Rhodoferax sp.]|nr:potassium channel protein [Rhodoferax sp.]